MTFQIIYVFYCDTVEIPRKDMTPNRRRPASVKFHFGICLKSTGRRATYNKIALLVFCTSSIASFVLVLAYFRSKSQNNSVLGNVDSSVKALSELTFETWNKLNLKKCEIRLRRIKTPNSSVLADQGLLSHIRNNVLLDLSKLRRSEEDGAQGTHQDPSEGQFMSKLVVPKFFSRVCLHRLQLCSFIILSLFFFFFFRTRRGITDKARFSKLGLWTGSLLQRRIIWKRLWGGGV